jgi:hypothetical protein
MPNGTFEQKPDTGALFTQRQANERQPVLKGTIRLSPELLGYLVQALNEGRPPVIEVAAWNAESRGGQPYFTVKVSPPFEREGQQAQPQRQVAMDARSTGGAGPNRPAQRFPPLQGANGPGPRRPPVAAAGQRPPAFEGVPPWLKRDQQQMKDWVAPKDDDSDIPF